MQNENSFDRPSIYRIHLKGRLDRKWEEWFNGLEITYTNGDTLLTGTVTDQSALHGILTKINDLGLALISVNKLSQTELSAPRKMP